MAKLNSGTRIYGNASIDANLSILGTNVSTSTTTGALTVSGGLGVQGNVNVGEQLSVLHGIQNTVIGNVTPSYAIFTNLSVSENGIFNNLSVNTTAIIGTDLTVNGNILVSNTISMFSNGSVLTSGNISVGNVAADNYYYPNGAPFTGIKITTSTAPPISGNVVGDQWYNTDNNAMYEYQYDGSSFYWVDITGPAFGYSEQIITNGSGTAETLSPFLLMGA